MEDNNITEETNILDTFYLNENTDESYELYSSLHELYDVNKLKNKEQSHYYNYNKQINLLNSQINVAVYSDRFISKEIKSKLKKLYINVRGLEDYEIGVNKEDLYILSSDLYISRFLDDIF